MHSSACGTCLLIRFINFKMVWKTIDLTHSKWHLLIIIDTGIEYEIWIHTLRTKLLNAKVHMHAINGHCYVQYKADHTSMLTSVNRLPKYLWYSDLCKIAAFFFTIWIHSIFSHLNSWYFFHSMNSRHFFHGFNSWNFLQI